MEPDEIPVPPGRGERMIISLIVLMGLAILVVSLGIFTSAWISRGDRLGEQREIIADKNEQVEALRSRAVKAEERVNRAAGLAAAVLAQAEEERAVQQGVTCVQYDRLVGFTAIIAEIIAANPDLPPDQRAALEPYLKPTPRPAECPTLE